MLKRRCRSCADDYITTDEELQSFLKRKITVPGSCVKCRKIHRLEEEIKSIKRILQQNAIGYPPKPAK